MGLFWVQLTCGQPICGVNETRIAQQFILSGTPPRLLSWHCIQIDQLKASNASLAEEVHRLKEELSKSKVSDHVWRTWRTPARPRSFVFQASSSVEFFVGLYCTMARAH